MKPDSENKSSDLSVSVLNDRKDTSKKEKYSNLSSPAALPNNDIRDLFRRAEK